MKKTSVSVNVCFLQGSELLYSYKDKISLTRAVQIFELSRVFNSKWT